MNNTSGRVLVFGSFQLSLALDAGDESGERTVRRKEREILRFLRCISESPESGGTVESLEVEGFTYGSPALANPENYYYNKHEGRAAEN